jgi:hypothetical protein
MTEPLLAQHLKVTQDINAIKQELRELNTKLNEREYQKQLLETKLEQKKEAIQYLKSLDADVLMEVLATMQNIQKQKDEKEENPLLELKDETREKYIKDTYQKIRKICEENDGTMDLAEYRKKIVSELPRPAQDAILIELEQQNKITFETYEEIDYNAVKKHDAELDAGIEYEINDDFTYVQLVGYDVEEDGEDDEFETEDAVDVKEVEVVHLVKMSDRVRVEMHSDNPNRCAKVCAAFTNKKTAASWGNWLIKGGFSEEYEVKESENFSEYKWELELTETLIDGARLLAKNDLSKPPKKK